MAVLYWDINASRCYQLLAIQKNIKPVIERKLKIKLEDEDIQDRYQLGQVLDIINFEVKNFSTAMQFTLSANFSKILITVGIEAQTYVLLYFALSYHVSLEDFTVAKRHPSTLCNV